MSRKDEEDKLSESDLPEHTDDDTADAEIIKSAQSILEEIKPDLIPLRKKFKNGDQITKLETFIMLYEPLESETIKLQEALAASKLNTLGISTLSAKVAHIYQHLVTNSLQKELAKPKLKRDEEFITHFQSKIGVTESDQKKRATDKQSMKFFASKNKEANLKKLGAQLSDLEVQIKPPSSSPNRRSSSS